jgi:hypothetical protein
MTTISATGYYAEGDCYRYPGAGDAEPPGGAKVLLLTRGGICVTGTWANTGMYLGWAPLPKRDRAKEQHMDERDELHSWRVLTDGDCEG